MAKKSGSTATSKVMFKKAGAKKRTSLGMARASRPKNKDARRNYKKTRGQGHP